MEQTVVQTGKVFKVYPDGPPGHGLKPLFE